VKVVAKTGEYTIYKKRNDRYAVFGYRDADYPGHPVCDPDQNGRAQMTMTIILIAIGLLAVELGTALAWYARHQ